MVIELLKFSLENGLVGSFGAVTFIFIYQLIKSIL